MTPECATSFGRYEYRPAQHLLLRDGVPVPIGSRALALLGTMLPAPGELVSHAELAAAAWPATYVAEGNLRVQMTNIRRALARPSSRPRSAISRTSRTAFRTYHVRHRP